MTGSSSKPSNINRFEEPEDITVIARAHQPDFADTSIVVIIPTFKRPDHLRITLQSVFDQDTRSPYAVIVMDNHPETGEGAQAAAEMLEKSKIPGIVLLAHRRGNCAAYNAGIATALANFPNATYLQIIDDDEIASPEWLKKMEQMAQQTGADCIGAPQIPVFPDARFEKWRAHPVFMPPYKTGGTVPILYSSGNVMIKTELLKNHGAPWLDERFNFLGGGDSDFYDRCKRDGSKFAWQPEAPVDETTPARRAELSWLNSRSFRNGSISALIQKKAARSPADHLSRILKSVALLAVSPYRSFIQFLKTRSFIMALNPMNVALGRLMMEIGFVNEQYKAAEKN
ncbi:MAG: glycosyltransferase family 2 protein [Pseudomonadota bacterium]